MRQQAAGCVCPSAEPQVAASCKRRAGVGYATRAAAWDHVRRAVQMVALRAAVPWPVLL